MSFYDGFGDRCADRALASERDALRARVAATGGGAEGGRRPTGTAVCVQMCWIGCGPNASP